MPCQYDFNMLSKLTLTVDIRFIVSRPSDHYFRSVSLSVCLCSFSQPSSIQFGSN